MVEETSRGRWDRSLWGEQDVGLAALFFAFLGSPIAWAIHFNLIYFLDALFCTTGQGGVGAAVGITTAILGAVSAASGVVAWRAWRGRRQEEETASSGTVDFLLVMGMLGAAFFTLLIVAEAVPPLFVPPCS